MSEGLFPIALQPDPRYFPKARGSFWARTGYALSREVITGGDNGKKQFNTSELLGNAVRIRNLERVLSRRRSLARQHLQTKWARQIALDAACNGMKEFGPDVRHKFLGQ